MFLAVSSCSEGFHTLTAAISFFVVGCALTWADHELQGIPRCEMQVVGSLTTHAEGNWVLRGARASERNFVVFIFLWVGVGVQLYNVYTELHHWRQHPQSIALGCSRFHVCGIILTSMFPGVR